jgi:hypothetical protein
VTSNTLQVVLAEADIVLGLGKKLAVQAGLGDVRLDRDDAGRRLGVARAAADVDVCLRGDN